MVLSNIRQSSILYRVYEAINTINNALSCPDIYSHFVFLWPPCVADAAVIFSSCFFFFSLPNLSGRRLDVYHTSTHGVALVQI